MKQFKVYANECDFGMIEARSIEDACTIAAQMAGYQSVEDMERQLETVSSIVAEEVFK